MSDVKRGLFVFYASENGRDGWVIVPHAEVPAWVKAPDVLGQLVNGFVAMKADEGEQGSLHYRAEVKLGAQAAAHLKDALAKRGAKAARELLYAPAANDSVVAIEASDIEL